MFLGCGLWVALSRGYSIRRGLDHFGAVLKDRGGCSMSVSATSVTSFSLLGFPSIKCLPSLPNSGIIGSSITRFISTSTKIFTPRFFAFAGNHLSFHNHSKCSSPLSSPPFSPLPPRPPSLPSVPPNSLAALQVVSYLAPEFAVPSKPLFAVNSMPAGWPI
jgi:hypothetical protein